MFGLTLSMKTEGHFHKYDNKYDDTDITTDPCQTHSALCPSTATVCIAFVLFDGGAGHW